MIETVLGLDTALLCDHCAIRHRAICASLGNAELRELSAISNRKSYAAGEIIQAAGQPSQYVGSIVQGVVKLSRGLSDGREQIVGLLFSADFLGRTFADLAQNDAIAITNVDVCSYPADAFEEVLSRHPGLEGRLFSDTLIELDRARDWLLLLGRKTALERLATLLLVLADRQSLRGCGLHKHDEGTSFDLPLTRNEMADYLGLTIETVSRQLGKLKRAGILSIEQKRHIYLKNRQALKELAGD